MYDFSHFGRACTWSLLLPLKNFLLPASHASNCFVLLLKHTLLPFCAIDLDVCNQSALNVRECKFHKSHRLRKPMPVHLKETSLFLLSLCYFLLHLVPCGVSSKIIPSLFSKSRISSLRWKSLFARAAVRSSIKASILSSNKVSCSNVIPKILISSWYCASIAFKTTADTSCCSL